MKLVSVFNIFLWFLLSSYQTVSADSIQSDIKTRSLVAIDLSSDKNEPIGKYLSYFKERSDPLRLNQAIDVFSSGEFSRSNSKTINFGIGSKPVWLHFEVQNRQQIKVLQRLSIETSWLDKIDLYFVSAGHQPVVFKAGDASIFSARTIKDRFFQFDYNFSPGNTSVYIRAQTPDPLVISIYLNSIDATYLRRSTYSYSYGFLYGGISVLMAYNLMLFFSLRNYKYLLYSLYLAFFMLTNLSYTGHAYKYLWPGSSHWQLWSNPVLMILYSVTGLMFAVRFLYLKKYSPKLYDAVIKLCISVVLLLLLSVLTSNHLAALYIAFSFILVFAITMPLLGVASLKTGSKSAKYFLMASVIHAVAAAITAMVVWGLVPYSVLGYRAIDIGMMLDAILLAMALAYQFRTVREEKLLAEKLSQIDPLTQLNNRRAFHKFVTSMWSNSVRYQHHASVIIVDIDHFKRINDTYGHAQGDDVLIEVANTLSKGIRNGDILARWGGEEFIVFLPDTKSADATLLAQRFCGDIESLQVKVATETISLTVSAGVADNEYSSESLDKMISHADKNLYLAKKQGRNRVVSTV